MIRTEHPLLRGEQPFEFGDCAGDIATLPVAGGEVVAGGQRVGVIRAEHPDAVGEQPVEFGDRAGESPNPAGPRPPDRGPYWVA